MTLRHALVPVLVAAGVAFAGCGAGKAGEPQPGNRAGADLDELRVSTAGWKTDFSRHGVPLGEFVSGGPPRDGIPPIDDPKTVPIAAADDWLDDREPVLVAEVDGRARAYPVQILVWHEIVNDRLGGRAIAVTYCPLCNSSLVFDRQVDGVGVLRRLGTTGNLRHSDLVMWDDRTESWWQQLTGEAVVGELTGTRLEALPSQTLGWADFKARYPDADVLFDLGRHRSGDGRSARRPPAAARGERPAVLVRACRVPSRCADRPSLARRPLTRPAARRGVLPAAPRGRRSSRPGAADAPRALVDQRGRDRLVRASRGVGLGHGPGDRVRRQ